MTHTRIKICGITRPDDALTAAACGADAIGLVFYGKSSRAVTIEQAAQIAKVVPPFVSIVALFVDESELEINRVLAAVPINTLQFHGDESPEFCACFGRPYMKAVRMRPDLDLLAACEQYIGSRGILLDAWQEGVPGGTGKSFDWQLAQLDLPLPMVLAGGLNSENVAGAIETLQPAAVDVSGGVESAPGVKDPNKIAKFIAAVRAADKT